MDIGNYTCKKASILKNVAIQLVGNIVESKAVDIYNRSINDDNYVGVEVIGLGNNLSEFWLKVREYESVK